MKHRKLPKIAPWIALTAAVACGVIAGLPVRHGIRIPVHSADGRMGFIDDKGRMVLPARWDSATPFSQDGVCYVESERRPMSFSFNLLRFPPKIAFFGNLTEEFWKMDRQGNLSAFTRVQYQRRDPAYEPTKPDSHGMSMIRDARTHRLRWIKTDGSEAFPGTWEAGFNFKNDDPAAVCKDGRWGFINRRGEAITPFEWEQTRGFDGKGRACVCANNKWGIINATGDLVVPLHFNYLADFDGKDMCAAHLESGSGFIGPSGKIIIPFRHVRVESFDRFDMAKVVMRDDDDQLRVGWIDRTGKLVVPCIYHDTLPEWEWSFRDHELLPICDSKGFGLIDRTGHLVVRSGGGALAHVEDPIAPGRFWITRIPNSTSPGTIKGPFKPACYNQSGKPIWQGNTWTRKQIATWLAFLFGALSAALFVIQLRRIQ